MRRAYTRGEALFGLALLTVFGVVVVAPVIAAYLPALAPSVLAEVLATPRQWRLFFNSILIAGGTALLAAALGTIPGAILALERLPGRRILAAALAAPMLIPSYVLAVAWIELLGKNGLLTRLLGELAPNAPSPNLYSIPGVILVLAFTYYPIAALCTFSAVRRMDRRFHEAASMSASGTRTFLAIDLPLLLPAIAQGAGLVFMLGLLSFAVPSLLQISAYPVEIYARFNSFHDPAGAVAQSLPLLGFAMLGYLVWTRFLQPRHNWPARGGNRNTFARAHPALSAAGAVYCWVLAGITAGLPLGALTVRALPPRGLLDAWLAAREEIFTTVLVASTSASLAVAFAFALTYHARLRRSQLHHWSAIPFLVSGPILGLGLIRLWNHHGPPGWVYDSFLIMVLACVARYLVFVHFGLHVAMRQLSPAAEEAAAVGGAGALRRAACIVLPQLRHGVVGLWGLFFVLALGELDTIMLVCPPGWTPLSVRLFSLMHYGPSQLVAALALVVVAVMLCAAAACGLLYLATRKLFHERG